MPCLREHIDECKKRGIPENVCIIVNYSMGIDGKEPCETDVSKLTKREKAILYKELDRVGLPRPKEG